MKLTDRQKEIVKWKESISLTDTQPRTIAALVKKGLFEYFETVNFNGKPIHFYELTAKGKEVCYQLRGLPKD